MLVKLNKFEGWFFRWKSYFLTGVAFAGGADFLAGEALGAAFWTGAGAADFCLGVNLKNEWSRMVR